MLKLHLISAPCMPPIRVINLSITFNLFSANAFSENKERLSHSNSLPPADVRINVDKQYALVEV